MQGGFSFKIAEGEHTRVYEFAFKSSLNLAIEGEFFYTKVVTVAPKYVVINAINAPIQIIQSDYFVYIDELAPFERKPFYWLSKRHERLIRAREVDESEFEDFKGDDAKWNQDWAFSNPFPP